MKILTVPHPILRKKAKRVVKIDKKVLNLIDQMKKTLLLAKEPKGVGLSAPQVGKSLQICMVETQKGKKLHILINPTLMSKSKKKIGGTLNKQSTLEGCLSVPGYWGPVKRHQTVTVASLNTTGEKQSVKYSGFDSTVIQHEIDHLNGILFIDRILEQKGKVYQIEKDKEGKEELVEVKLT